MEITNEHKRVNRQLNILALALMAAEIMIVVLGELDVIENGVLPVSYGLQLLVVLLTIFLIPTSLKLLNWTPIRKRIDRELYTYRFWAIARLFALYIPVLLGTSLYFLMLDSSALYCAVVSLIAIVFVWPTEERMLDELTPKEIDDEA